MVEFVYIVIGYSALLIAFSLQVTAQPVQCTELSPPQHGSINSTDGNNIYSKIAYTCDAGYTIQGPPSRQCLPVPYPNTAIWVPDDITSCVPEPTVEPMDSLTEEMDTVLVYDPTEEEVLLSEAEWLQHASSEEPDYTPDSEAIAPDSEATADPDKDSDEVEVYSPPSLALAEMDVKPWNTLSASIEIALHADELCTITEEMPESYQCTTEHTVVTSTRWTVNMETGECLPLDLCGRDDEIHIAGLFHTYSDCAERCLS